MRKKSAPSPMPCVVPELRARSLVPVSARAPIALAAALVLAGTASCRASAAASLGAEATPDPTPRPSVVVTEVAPRELAEPLEPTGPELSLSLPGSPALPTTAEPPSPPSPKRPQPPLLPHPRRPHLAGEW